MGLVRSLLAALLVASALTAAAVSAMYVTAAPELVSLAIEPVTMLLLPGAVVSFAAAGSHDFSPLLVVEVSFAFYVVLCFAIFWHRSRRRSSPARRSR